MKKKNKLGKSYINLFTSKFVFISGVTRSGKSFLCPIISSFKKSEMFFMNSVAESISYIDALKNINREYSDYLFKLILNETVYNLNIGRNINPRKLDYTSFYKFKSPKVYLDRIKGPEGDNVIKKIKKQKHIYPLMFHDALINPELIFSNLKSSKIIFIKRHPAELIDEWFKKKYYGIFYKNPRNVTLSFKYKKNLIPYWGLKYKKEIVKSKNAIDKTIYLLSALIEFQTFNYKNLSKSQKEKVLFLKFDEMISNTNNVVKKICKFLKCSPSSYTKKIIKKEKGNRKADYSKTEALRKFILKKGSAKAIKIYLKLEKSYFDN